jgi:hypothetical protein
MILERNALPDEFLMCKNGINTQQGDYPKSES